MSKKKLRRGAGFSDTTRRFVPLRHYLLKSAAWTTMHSDAKALLIDVWTRYNGVNNGEISYSVREAEHIGITQWQASRMFAILIERGFLAVVKDASFKAARKQARSWRITDERCGGEPATKDFMGWRPISFSSVAPTLPYSSTRASMSPKKPPSVAWVLPRGPKTAGSQ
jgi:hypothetical protein